MSHPGPDGAYHHGAAQEGTEDRWGYDKVCTAVETEFTFTLTVHGGEDVQAATLGLEAPMLDGEPVTAEASPGDRATVTVVQDDGCATFTVTGEEVASVAGYTVTAASASP